MSIFDNPTYVAGTIAGKQILCGFTGCPAFQCFNNSRDAARFYVRNMMNVITYGTYDLLHIGHIRMLQRCRALGDRLIVALSTDTFNLSMKNKTCIQTYEERKGILEAIRYVDLVIPEENWEQKIADVQQYSIDTFAIGDDWMGKFDFLKEYCKVIYLSRTEGISTTQRKQEIVQTFSIENL